ncbi:MAG: DUF3857 domain-containing protein [Microscillaceae bacterium]|nr:DUF3857 domain-containing protein [Microscillaceae bacterium]
MNTILQKMAGCLWLCLSLCQAGMAQYYPAPMKWGKISDQELALKECAYEKDAKAVILCDYGKLEILPGQPINIKHHKRIKILKDAGLDLADITLTYYHKNNFEKISGIRAQTLNQDPSGKTIDEKVESKQIFETKVDEYFTEVRFTFPNVKVGSIIEFDYTLTTESYYFLEAWVFQDEIPTMYSEFTGVITDQLTYDILYQGKRLFTKYQKNADGGNRWILENLPSLKDEPFVWNYWDYAEKIRFQLAGYKKYVSGSVEYQKVITDWSGIMTDILERESVMTFLSKSGVASNIVAELNLNGKTNQEKVKAIYDYVNQNLSWDGVFRITPSKNPKELLDSKSGSSSDLNFMMLLLLDEAKIEAYPALISTKKHGLPLKKFAFLNQFNHLICAVNLDNKITFLDARAAFHPYNLLDRMDLNQAAFVLDKKNPRWVDITPPVNNSRTVYINQDLRKTEESDLQGTISFKYDGYYAVSQRKKLSENGKDEFIKTELNFDGLSLDKIQLNDVENLEQPFMIEADLKGSQPFDEDMVYYNPIYVNFYEENFLKSDKRLFPVDFLHPDRDTYVLNLSLPENYEVVELPKDAQIKLPNEGGTYLFSIKIVGNTLQITSRVTINKASFMVEEYPYLKEFFDLIRTKHAEQIVLKKKA